MLSLISLIVSFLSAIISFLSFVTKRSKLVFLNDDQIEPETIIEDQILAIGSIKGDPYNKNFPSGIIIHLKIFNPSPQDIAYFYMEFKFKKLNMPILTKESFGYMDNQPKFVMNDPLKGKFEINLPTHTYGIFKAHSYTPLDIFVPITTHPIPSEATFQFRYAVKSFPFIGSRYQYSIFSKLIDMSNVEKTMHINSATMQRLKQSKQ